MESFSKKSAKEPQCEHISFVSKRKFGIEIELNAFDGKAKPDDGGKVAGIDHICSICNANTEEGAEVRGWEHTNNNTRWVIKPDSSCGMEICTPPVTGWDGLKKVCKVVEALAKDSKVKADKRCSVHVHIDLSDLDEEQISRVLGWYVKCEPVVMDAVPEYRKINRYCQFIGMTSSLSHEMEYTPQELINIIGEVKYYSMNAKALRKDSNRRTIEFRVIEGDGCKDAYLIKNWVRFLIHFIERSIQKPLTKYDAKNPWSGLCWLDPEDVFRFLGFSINPQEYELSKGLQQTRSWFMARLIKYMDHRDKSPRVFASKEFHKMLSMFRDRGIEINVEDHLSPKELASALYGESYKY